MAESSGHLEQIRAGLELQGRERVTLVVEPAGVVPRPTQLAKEGNSPSGDREGE
ncbi:MAG: hypothetical protein M3P14_10695 [Chloroflexota bacterium]|nr:hypothetical protein [Chloroflexota bacterium]